MRWCGEKDVVQIETIFIFVGRPEDDPALFGSVDTNIDFFTTHPIFCRLTSRYDVQLCATTLILRYNVKNRAMTFNTAL